MPPGIKYNFKAAPPLSHLCFSFDVHSYLSSCYIFNGTCLLVIFRCRRYLSSHQFTFRFLQDRKRRTPQIKHWCYGGRLASNLLSEKWFCLLPQTKLSFRRLSIIRLLKMVTTCYDNRILFFGGCPYLSFKTFVLMGEACLLSRNGYYLPLQMDLLLR